MIVMMILLATNPPRMRNDHRKGDSWYASVSLKRAKKAYATIVFDLKFDPLKFLRIEKYYEFGINCPNRSSE